MADPVNEYFEAVESGNLHKVKEFLREGIVQVDTADEVLEIEVFVIVGAER